MAAGGLSPLSSSPGRLRALLRRDQVQQPLRSLGNTAPLALASISLEVLIGFTAAKLFFELRDRRWSVGLRSLYLMPMMVTP